MDFRVWKSSSSEDVRRFLAGDRDLGAYALAYLNPKTSRTLDIDFPTKYFTQYYFASGLTGRSLVFYVNQPNSLLLTFGDKRAIEATLLAAPSLRKSYLATASPEHFESIRKSHHISAVLTMNRMLTTKTSFKPCTTKLDASSDLCRLGSGDIEEINSLYRTGPGSNQYPARVVNEGIYWGVRKSGILAGIAGTHVISEEEKVAVVGNVYTHPSARGLGFAQATTSAVTSSLLAIGCDEVVLTVDPENTPAVSAYKRLGFNLKSEVIEGRLSSRRFYRFKKSFRKVKRSGSDDFVVTI
jgi:ribosomal protein S18 acetylase RimI-like enzyme|tara:strand:+ start:1123 stop:2016 length:894 start_codon:yes stop_codon:yes gene_type:complete